MCSASDDRIGFVHRYVAGPQPEEAWTLLLLHGTGGDENALLSLGQQLLPTANFLSPRGKVLEQGMPRFFRRLAEGVFDQDDLLLRTGELARFLGDAASLYGFDVARIVAVGYSNGANIIASLLLREPKTLAAAILLHPMVPFVPDTLPDLQGKPLFIGAGQNDPLVPAANTRALVTLFRESGAEVVVHWHQGGHALTQEEAQAAQVWLKQRM